MPKFIKLEMITGQNQTDDLENVSETTATVYVNADEIREFYPRRENRQGTRISFRNSAGIAVRDTLDEVHSKLLGLNN